MAGAPVRTPCTREIIGRLVNQQVPGRPLPALHLMLEGEPEEDQPHLAQATLVRVRPGGFLVILPADPIVAESLLRVVTEDGPPHRSGSRPSWMPRPPQSTSPPRSSTTRTEGLPRSSRTSPRRPEWRGYFKETSLLGSNSWKLWCNRAGLNLLLPLDLEALAFFASLLGRWMLQV